MKTAKFEKIKPGDLVQVPRSQFAPNRRGWNGWLFSEAVVLKKGISKKNGRRVVLVNMRTPGRKRNEYGEMEKTFFADYVFQTNCIETARRFMEEYGVKNKEQFEEFVKSEDVTGCDWIKFLIDKGFLFE